MTGLIFLILIMLGSTRCRRPAHCFVLSGGAVVLALILGLIRDADTIAARGLELNPLGLAISGGLFLVYSLVSLAVYSALTVARRRSLLPQISARLRFEERVVAGDERPEFGGLGSQADSVGEIMCNSVRTTLDIVGQPQGIAEPDVKGMVRQGNLRERVPR